MTSIGIIEDHQIVRTGLCALLGQQADFCIAWQAGSIKEAKSNLPLSSVEIISLDLELADGYGLDLMPEILELQPKVKVIILSSRVIKEEIKACLDAGAFTFISKLAQPEFILNAFVQAALGYQMMDSVVLSEYGRERVAEINLTPKELQVVKAIAGGLSNAEIADRLFLSEKTVKWYVSGILFKLDLRDRTQIASFAWKSKLVH